MHISVDVSTVAGDFLHGEFTSMLSAAKFLTDHDHEGSNISISVIADDEEVYKVVEALMGKK